VDLHPEVQDVLDDILRTAERAKPASWRRS
jgi:hypothetical protein